MKKNISFFIASLLVLHSLVACTLSMDEWIESDENKGYSDIATEKNDFYSLSYQYKDHTRSLTDKIRDYIVNVEADSILYFLDNTPDEWMPQVGGCVVCNCCETFPMGLIARVLSVEKVNGMYKVVTTETEIDDAFEDFDLDMDMDILSDNGENDNITRAINSNARRMRGEPDSVSIDWTMYNMITKGYKIKNINGVATRALEDEYEEDIDQDNTKSKEEPIITLDESSALGRLVINKYSAKVVNKFFLGLYSVTETHIKKQVQLKKKREYTDITNTNGLKLSYVIGRDFINPPNGETEIKKATAQFKDWWKNHRDEFIMHPYNEKLGLLDKINDQAIVAEIPLPSCPIGLIIRIKPIVEVTAGIFGTGDFIWYTSKSRSITEIIDGKTKQDKTTTNKDDKKLKLPSSKYAANITGRFNIGGGLEIFIGLGKRLNSKKAAGVGAFGAVTLELLGDFQGTVLGQNDLAMANNLLSLTAYGEVGGKVLAGDYGDIKFLTKKFELWKGFELPYYPKLEVEDDLKMFIDVDSKTGKPFCDFTLSYKFPKLGVFFAGAFKSLFKPGLYLYKNGSIGSSEPIDVPSSTSKLSAGTTYKFHYKSEDEIASYTAVPYLKYTPTGDVTLFAEHERLINTEAYLTPMVKYLTKKMSNGKYQHWYQVYGDELTDDSPMAKNVPNPQDYNEFECAMPFKIFNPSAMHNVWDDFGILYTVSWGGGKVQEIHKSLMKTCIKPGIYVPRVTFILPKKSDLKWLHISGQLYFVYKDDPKKLKYPLVGSDYKDFLYTPVTYGTVKGYETLNTWYHFNCPFDDYTIYDWESEKALPMTISTN